MLVLSRRIGERIHIEPGIEIAVVAVHGSKVQIGVEAPDDIRIRRVPTPHPAGKGRQASGILAACTDA
jgi:carbon storage regulator